MFAPFAASVVANLLAAGKLMELRLTAVLLGLSMLVAGCAQPASPIATANPADASAPVPPVSYRSVTAPYTSMRPSTPMTWRRQNDNVAPSFKSDR